MKLNMCRNELLLILTSLSAICLACLALLKRYSGSFWPSTQQSTGADLVWIWVIWAALIIIPVLTLALFALRFMAKKK
jgi:hypothetical protein